MLLARHRLRIVRTRAPVLGDGLNPPDLKAQSKLGKTEGQVNLIAWAGYVEDGSNDPKVDWVSDFEKQTGCQVNSKTAASSDEMVKPDEDRPVRRGLRLRRRLPAPHRLR